ncbi:MAG: hypothetical protein K2N72_05020 [Oscillospiraceae bacterium]|nr:hypothetical protein [Oscillospiraceae bacterium]
MKKETYDSLPARAGKGLLWWLGGEFICVIFNMCMIPLLVRFMAMKIFTAIASAIIVNGLFFNFAYNCAVRDKNIVRYHGAERDRKMPLKMALTAPLPEYIMWIALLLSKLGIIGDIFNWYIIGNMQCLAWVDLFTQGRDIGSLSYIGLFGLLLLILISPVTIILTYEITFRDIDIKALLLYGKKDNR